MGLCWCAGEVDSGGACLIVLMFENLSLIEVVTLDSSR